MANKTPPTKGRTKAEILELKSKAKVLFKEGKLQQKEIANMLGVSENTMTDWVSRYGWNTDSDFGLYESDNYILSFLRYLKAEKPPLYKTVLDTFEAFVRKSIKKHDASENVS